MDRKSYQKDKSCGDLEGLGAGLERQGGMI